MREEWSISKNETILLISKNFPPMTGGMEKMMFHTFKELQLSYTSYLIGPSGCKDYSPNIESTREAPAKPFFIFTFISFMKALLICLKTKPRIILGGSGAVSPIVVILAKIFSKKSVIFIHGLDLIVDNWLYQTFFIPFIRRADALIANSNNTKSLAINKNISPDKIHIIHPGVDIPLTNSLSPLKGGLRHQHELEDADILLSVGRLIPRKGLAEFIENAFIKIVKKNPKTRLVIIGKDPTDSLDKHESVLQKIKQLSTKYGLDEKIILLGEVDDDRVKNAYQESDAFIFPLIETPGDIEGFGIVAVEAASFGLPVFAFNLGGVNDAIVNNKTGFLIQPADYDLFAERIIKYFTFKNRNISPEACRIHAQKFSWENYGSSLRQFLSTLT